MGKFKYDVAFSFLAQDEDLAQRLTNIISERYDVFLYSEKQKELAGKDGEQEFADVFVKQCRVAVILYREQWGQTTWTRVEENAIRGRSYDEGYDFTLFIPLDDIKTVPKWIPKNRLYFDLDRFGEQSAAAVIISKINEQSGKPRPSSPLEEAKRLDEDLKFNEEIQKWRTSSEGVQQVIDTVEELYSDLETQVGQILEVNPASKFKIDKGRQRDLVVQHAPISMTFDLHIVYGNSLDHVAMIVQHWNAQIVRSKSVMYFDDPKTLFEENFIPMLCRDKQIRWEAKNRINQTYTNKTLLEHCMKTFMDRVRK